MGITWQVEAGEFPSLGEKASLYYSSRASALTIGLMNNAIELSL